MTAVRSLLPHVLAGGLVVTYAWLISGTPFVTTAVQFVSPLALILIVHLAWLAATRSLNAGFSHVAFRRSLQTAANIAVLTVLLAAVLPMPAEASADFADAAGAVLGFILCFAMIAFVVAAAAAILWYLACAASWLWSLIFKRPPGPGSRLYDAGAVAMAFLAIGTASLEGVPGAFSLSPEDHASMTYTVAAPPARVWQMVGKATSPHFPLPVMLHSIPRPVAVMVDEGAELGARRIVRFTGREGEGDLTLKVVRRTDEEAVFEAVSDESPIANWVHHKALTFRVEPAGSGSKLTVALDYDRLLAPAWFFGPYIRTAATLAVDVLARDTKQRAEVP